MTFSFFGIQMRHNFIQILLSDGLVYNVEAQWHTPANSTPTYPSGGDASSLQSGGKHETRSVVFFQNIKVLETLPRKI